MYVCMYVCMYEYMYVPIVSTMDFFKGPTSLNGR